MKKTGRLFSGYPIFLTLLLALGMFSRASAQEASVEATVSETQIFTGERITLSIDISGSFTNISRPTLPDFDGFRLLSDTPSTSRSFSFVNGESSTTYSYRYVLIADQEGEHSIPPISVEIDGTQYRTDPITVTITDRNSSATAPSASDRPDIFLRLEVSDDNPVTGQQIVTDVVLYFKSQLQVNSYQPVPGWKADGFWKEELENTERPRAESVIMEGVRYSKARLKQFSLFPTKAGTLTLSPYEIVISIRATSSRNNRLGSIFGGFGTSQRRIELQTEPIEIEVDPLPEITDASYIGAVGSFSVTRSISATDALVGESIEIETQVSGTGNVPIISKPEYQLPDGLEIYDPQENTYLNRQNQKISGRKTFTDVVIARRPGTFTIPAAELAYYNPDSDRYRIETVPEITFTVSPDPDAQATVAGSRSLPIRPVTGLASWTATGNRTGSLFNLWWFWAGLLFPVLALPALYRWKQYRDRMDTDTRFARSQKALDRANERLGEVVRQSEEGDIKGAYYNLHKVLTGFIGDRLGMPEAGLSDREYIEALQNRDLDAKLIKNIRMLLDKCSSISYAPDTTHEYLKSHVGLTQNILKQLKKEL